MNKKFGDEKSDGLKKRELKTAKPNDGVDLVQQVELEG